MRSHSFTGACEDLKKHIVSSSFFIQWQPALFISGMSLLLVYPSLSLWWKIGGTSAACLPACLRKKGRPIIPCQDHLLFEPVLGNHLIITNVPSPSHHVNPFSNPSHSTLILYHFLPFPSQSLELPPQSGLQNPPQYTSSRPPFPLWKKLSVRHVCQRRKIENQNAPF